MEIGDAGGTSVSVGDNKPVCCEEVLGCRTWIGAGTAYRFDAAELTAGAEGWVFKGGFSPALMSSSNLFGLPKLKSFASGPGESWRSLAGKAKNRLPEQRSQY
jgi:hypothetical protein